MKKVLIACSFLITISACQSKKEKTSPVIKDITQCVYASGVVKSKNQYDAYTTASGIITKVWVNEGDSVSVGDPIFSLNSKVADLQNDNLQLLANNASVEQNKGKLNEALLLRDLARNRMLLDSSVYFRQKSLFSQQVGSKLELEKKELAYSDAKSAYFSASVRYDDLKRQIELNDKQQKNLLAIGNNSAGDYIVRSNVAGKVFKLNKKLGELATPQFALALVGSSSDFILEMQIDERDITKIRNGMKAIVSLESYPDNTFDATITTINPIMDIRSKTFTIEASFITQPTILYPFLTLEASIILEEKKNALLIPVTFLINDSTVLSDNGQEQLIKVGMRDNNMVEVLSGLSKNDVIVKPKP